MREIPILERPALAASYQLIHRLPFIDPFNILCFKDLFTSFLLDSRKLLILNG
jgi:hypothetical protein